MRITAAATAAAILSLSQAAWAQTPSSSAHQPSAANPGQSTAPSQESIRGQIQKNLQAAGFSDIKMMPSSFLVRAKDPNGNPVMMVINPDSVKAVVESPATPHQGSTTGSASPNQGSNPAHR